MLKRGELVRVRLQGPTKVYGEAWTSSASAIRETMHEALDVWIDEEFLADGVLQVPHGTAREVFLEVTRG